MTNNITKTDTLVIGAGQAGIAMSEHLSKEGIEHIVLEKNRIAEAWRTRRWDSLVANGPCWHDRFPSMLFEDDQEGFIHHDKVADYFQKYAEHINAPVQTGVAVTKVTPLQGRQGYHVTTSEGELEAKRIVVATGAFQVPSIPPIIPSTANVQQIHSDSYKNPEQLPEGAVLVIGSGSSGVQIAKELNAAGKTVYLSVGAHERPPRRYRGRDNVWWLGVLGGWDREKPNDGPLKGFAVSGMNGGETVDFRKLAHDGIHLLGLTKSFSGDTLTFNDDLFENVNEAEQNYLALLDVADKYVEDNGLDLPEEPEAREFLELPESISNPSLSIDFSESNITSVIWATGFKYDYRWLEVDVLDDVGRPLHNRGVTSATGIYFVGLPFLSGQGSSFIWGVWHDAGRIAEHIAIKKKYHEYS